MHTYTFSSEIHLWHRHLQSHPPFSLSWSQRRQIPLTSFLFLPLCCLLSLPQLSDVLCSLFLLFLSSSHLFFLSVEKGKEMWIYVVLGTWNAFCVVQERLLRSRSQDRDSRPLRFGPGPPKRPLWGAAVAANHLESSFSTSRPGNVLLLF